MVGIKASVDRYEGWLRAQLGREIVEADLARKREKMAQGAFAFLRATYWRYAETILEICPELASAPSVFAVGDVHLENFGTWRDADGRLVWGINDFDEAAEIPYALDLVRLAASAVIARGPASAPRTAIGKALLEGYRAGLARPQPVVLDRDRAWMRELFVVSEKQRAKFWDKIKGLRHASAPRRFREALSAAMPQPGLSIATAPRSAGAGSLGRPRWVGIAEWRGAPVVREAKALLRSAWPPAAARAFPNSDCRRIATGRYRAFDPFYRVADGIVVRRLSPNNRKIEAEKSADLLVRPRLLAVMGVELANVHLGVKDRREAIARHLASLKPGWLDAAAASVAAATLRDFKDFRSA
jgi:hypothetical protein